jgi:hypothetical protein
MMDEYTKNAIIKLAQLVQDASSENIDIRQRVQDFIEAIENGE